MANEEIAGAVQTAVADALGLDEDEVTMDATLMDELGAESIDLLDILFRLERSLGVKIQASDLGDYIQGGIPDEEFGDDEGIVTPKGFEQLQRVMPQIGDDMAGKLEAEQIMSLFTVGNLVDMVAARRAAAG
jgi:acyl carrier protein